MRCHSDAFGSGSNAASRAIECAKIRSRSHDFVIRFYDTGTTVGVVADTGSTLSLMTLNLMALGLVAWRFQRAAADRARAGRSRLLAFRY